MIKRVLVGLLAFVVLAVGVFVTYGWWTRRGAPEFARGGVFNTASPSTSQPSSRASVKGQAHSRAAQPGATGASSAGAPRAGAGRAASGTAAGGSGASSAAARTITRPTPGTYHYAGSGSERVRFGPTSGCGWEINDVQAVAKRSRGGATFDWTYSDSRLERHVYDYETRSVALEYVGAAVTCFGVRETSEETYEPPAVWVKTPWDVGFSWSFTTRAGDRVEETTARIAARERVRVPAGTFTAFRIETSTQMSGDSSGTHRGTNWFVPSLGINVKRISETDVQHGSAQFDSSIRLELASMP